MLGLSALTWFVIIVAGYALLLLILPREYMWIPFVAVVVAMAVLAYHIVPDETDDLYRYYGMLDIMRERGKAGLDYIVNLNWYNWQTYITFRYYFYFLSFFPNNHYLAAVTIFIVYGLMFLVMYKAARRYQVSKGYVLLGTLFFLSTYWFYDTASGIRNGLAFAVVIACAYYHLAEKRNITLCLFGYVAACLLHSSPILPVALVVLTLLTMKFNSKFINVIMILGLAAGGAFIQMIAAKSHSEFISSIAEKSVDHSADSGMSTNTGFLVNIVTLVIVLIVIWYFSVYYDRDKATDPMYRFYRYSSTTAFFMIGSLFSSLIFLRFARWILPIMGAVLFMVGMQKQEDFVKKQPPNFIYTGEKKMVLRVRTQGAMLLVYFAYICVHFLYACVGSSLIWMHF